MGVDGNPLDKVADVLGVGDMEGVNAEVDAVTTRDVSLDSLNDIVEFLEADTDVEGRNDFVVGRANFASLSSKFVRTAPLSSMSTFTKLVWAPL